MKLNKQLMIRNGTALIIVHRGIFAGVGNRGGYFSGWCFDREQNIKRKIYDDWKYTYRHLVSWNGSEL